MSVYYNDLDPYCGKVLEKNIRAGHLPGGWVDGRDIREVRASELVGYQHLHLFAGIGAFPLAFERARVPRSLRIITGGFPCTDISNAGRRAGITGPQSGLWSQMVRLLQEMLDRDLGPDYLCIENVAALLGRGLSRVLADLAACGYDAEWQCLRASDFGAPHRRERVFLLSYPMREGQSPIGDRVPARTNYPTRASGTGDGSEDVAYPDGLPGRLWGRSDGQAWAQAGCGGEEELADTAIKGLPIGRSAGLPTHSAQAGTGMESQLERGSELANSDREGLEVGQGIGCDLLAQCPPTQRDGIAGAGKRAVEPCLGGDLDGSSGWMDRYRWPAEPGAEQYEWEPPRTITMPSRRAWKQSAESAWQHSMTHNTRWHRAARLRALGNGIVIPCAEYTARLIVEREKGNREDDTEEETDG